MEQSIDQCLGGAGKSTLRVSRCGLGVTESVCVRAEYNTPPFRLSSVVGNYC